MVLNKPHLLTKLQVWQPKYNSGSLTKDYDEPVALLHKRKTDFGSPIILVEFTKAKHLQGQRFAIRKEVAQKHAVGTNGKSQMYEIPLSHFESWESASEVKQLTEDLFNE